MHITIRNAEPKDAPSIASGNRAMALETEELELDAERVDQGVRAVFADPSRGFYLVAESGGRVVGQMMVTYEWSDWRNGVFWWIQSVFVERECRRQGVFGALYAEVTKRARRTAGVCGLRLYVEGENHTAQNTYERLGMTRTAYRVYEEDFVLRR